MYIQIFRFMINLCSLTLKTDNAYMKEEKIDTIFSCVCVRVDVFIDFTSNLLNLISYLWIKL